MAANGLGDWILGASSSFLLALATDRAFLIDWKGFIGTDKKKKTASAKLSDIFRSPCFEWDLSLTSRNIREHSFLRITLEDSLNDDMNLLLNSTGDSWENHQIIKAHSSIDYSGAIFLNPSFGSISKLFPMNYLSRIREIKIPVREKLTFVVRYLFSPNIEKYEKNVR